MCDNDLYELNLISLAFKKTLIKNIEKYYIKTFIIFVLS